MKIIVVTLLRFIIPIVAALWIGQLYRTTSKWRRPKLVQDQMGREIQTLEAGKVEDLKDAPTRPTSWYAQRMASA